MDRICDTGRLRATQTVESHCHFQQDRPLAALMQGYQVATFDDRALRSGFEHHD